MKYRPALVFWAIAVVCVFAAFAVDDPVGEPGSTAHRAPRLGLPPRADAPTPLPQPIPGEPLASINVKVVNLPLDEGGHLAMSEQSAAPRKVEIINRDWRFELVGFTSATTLPDVGVFGMSRMCGEEFEASRMCTIGEALGTVDLPSLNPTSVEFAWVRDDTALGGPWFWCDGWSRTTGTGLVVTIDGAVATASCGQQARIACCASVR